MNAIENVNNILGDPNKLEPKFTFMTYCFVEPASFVNIGLGKLEFQPSVLCKCDANIVNTLEGKFRWKLSNFRSGPIGSYFN